MTDPLLDWDVLNAEFHRRFDDRRSRATQQSMGLTGTNFMTSEFLGILADANGDPVEVTTGLGIDHQRIYGLTWAPLGGGSRNPLSRLVTSLDEIDEAISSAFAPPS